MRVNDKSTGKIAHAGNEAFRLMAKLAQDKKMNGMEISVTMMMCIQEIVTAQSEQGGAGGLAMRAEARDKMRQWVDHWERHDQGPTFDA